MALQILGNGGSVAEVDGTTFRAQRVTNRPTDHGALGHYRVSVVTGTMAAALAANAQVFQFKWTDATRFAVVSFVRVRFKTLTVFTSATLTDFGVDLVAVRAYALGGGGTTLTLTGDNAQLRTNMGASLATLNVSTTAALTAATTLDAQPMTQSIGHPNRRTPATAIEEPLDSPPILELNVDPGHGEHPLVLAANEGFVIRNRTVWPAAGTGIFQVEVAWAEVAAY